MKHETSDGMVLTDNDAQYTRQKHDGSGAISHCAEKKRKI
jgi:hypothetical protein